MSDQITPPSQPNHDKEEGKAKKEKVVKIPDALATLPDKIKVRFPKKEEKD